MSSIAELPICVLGMHRSGTSCLAGSLEQAGVHLGEVVNKSPSNPKGNKESKVQRGINEDLLAFNGGSWDKPPEQLSWNSDLQARRDSYIENAWTASPWGFKDPRSLLTLPFWREALGDLRFVATVRHPAAVARSLMSRAGLQPKMAPLHLWTEYNQRLLNLCQTETVHLVSFDWHQSEYLGALEHLFGVLGLTLPEQIPFFEKGLRSEEKLWPDCDQETKTKAEKLYSDLLQHTLDIST